MTDEYVITDYEDNEIIIDGPGLITLSDKKVVLRPYKPRPFKEVQYLSDAELEAGKGGTLIADSECYPNYFLIPFKCVKTGKYLIL